MILFYCTTYYQLLFGIVYCLRKKSFKEVTLVVDDFLYNSRGIIDRIKEEFIPIIYHVPFIAIKENSLEWVVRNAKEQIDKLPIIIDEFTEIYVASAHSWFGIYLAKNGYKFSIVEESCGILSKIDKLRENVSLTSKKHDEYAQMFGLYMGNADCVKQVVCSNNSAKYVLEQEKVEVFDLVEEMMVLSNEKMNALKTIFCSDYIEEGSADGVLLLTQHFANLGVLEWVEQEELYKILLDYFGNPWNKIYIKSHPADIMDYKSFIPGCKYINKEIPSEFFPFIFEKLPKTIITVSSTALDGIGTFFENCIAFDFWFEQWFYLLHNFYCAIEQLKSYISDGYKIYAYGVNILLLNNLCKFSLKLKKPITYLDELKDLACIKEKSIVIIDDFYNEKNIDLNYFTQNLSDDTICIYMNSKFGYLFCQKEIVKKMKSYIPVFVKIEKNKKSTICGKLYCFSKGEITNMVEVRKKLKYENSIVYTEMFKENELKIKILEGILRATEERLQYFLKEQK